MVIISKSLTYKTAAWCIVDLLYYDWTHSVDLSFGICGTQTF